MSPRRLGAFLMSLMLICIHASANRDLPLHDEPSPQSTGGGVSKDELLYIGGGFAAAIALGLLLFCIMRRRMVANRETNPPPSGADEAKIGALRTVVYMAPPQEEEPSECEICLEEFTDGEPLKKLPCEHSFHPQCARRALLLKSTCPKCRSEV